MMASTVSGARIQCRRSARCLLSAPAPCPVITTQTSSPIAEAAVAMTAARPRSPGVWEGTPVGERDRRTTRWENATVCAGAAMKGSPMTESSTIPPALEVEREAPDRNLALELVRVTEAAAMAAGRWVGRGDKNGGDAAAVNGVGQLVGTVSMNGIVVIGEGEKDNAPMLYNGEHVGDRTGPECDVAVDPIDGTTLTAKGMSNALSVLAVAELGTMYDPSAVFYIDKLVTGPEAADYVDINAPAAANVRAVARAKQESPADVTVCIPDRPS